MIVLDENLPPALATFLETLGEPARHVRNLNLQGVTDETILQELVAGEDCFITKDRAMLRRPDIIALWQQRRLGLIVFPNSNLRAIESSQLL